MSAVGSYLRNLRGQQGVSLEELARATRVLYRHLEALEADDLAALPAPVFTKGFIRAYCQVLGVAPDEALALYDPRSNEGRPAAPAPPPSPAKPSMDTQPGGTPPPSVATPAVAASAPAIPQAAASPASSYRLVARTTETTWMRVRTEDGRTIEETIPANEVREWVSNYPFVLSIGNAGGVTLELNGRPIPRLGASGAVITRLVLPSEPP